MQGGQGRRARGVGRQLASQFLRRPTSKTGDGPSMVVSLSSTILTWKVAKHSSISTSVVSISIAIHEIMNMPGVQPRRKAERLTVIVARSRK